MIVVDDLMAAMSRQGIAIPGNDECVKLYYREADFTLKLQEARKLRESGKKVELLPE